MGVTEIGNHAFEFCTSLKKLHIPSGVTRIPNETFVCCDSLTECDIPEGVTFIARGAFWGCKSLKSIDIPRSVEEIDIEAFQNCSSLKSVYVSWETPLDITYDVFNRKRTCILYVPLGTKSLYYDSTWGDCFDNIVEYDVDGINDAITAEQSEEVARYSADGQRLSAPTQGLNIVKCRDGSIRKVMVR